MPSKWVEQVWVAWCNPGVWVWLNRRRRLVRAASVLYGATPSNNSHAGITPSTPRHYKRLYTIQKLYVLKYQRIWICICFDEIFYILCFWCNLSDEVLSCLQRIQQAIAEARGVTSCCAAAPKSIGWIMWCVGRHGVGTLQCWARSMLWPNVG